MPICKIKRKVAIQKEKVFNNHLTSNQKVDKRNNKIDLRICKVQRKTVQTKGNIDMRIKIGKHL